MDHRTDAQADGRPSLRDATRVWWRIGILSFGGPAAQIALMHRELVEERDWLTEQQFLNALSFCMLLPGPEAMQLATYAGWRLHGTFGGLIAGLLFVLPGAAIIMVLAAIYNLFGNVTFVEAFFFGIKAAVLVIVVEALLRVAKKALSRTIHWYIAGLAFIGIYFFSVPFPIIIVIAGLWGWLTGPVNQLTPSDGQLTNVSVIQTGKTVVLWLVIWFAPFLLLALANAPEILVSVGTFFSTLAVVTFGGAYAVLAYMAQDVVVHHGWLTASEMVDALGLAETTPGPLILVTQFVGFAAGFKDGGFWMGFAAGIVALWATFVPCFLWIFTGAPYIDAISNLPRLRGALEAITAAVVGVILNLSLWFALHVLFDNVSRDNWGPVTLWRPEFASFEPLAGAIFVMSGVLVFRLHWGIIKVLGVASILGAILRFFA